MSSQLDESYLEGEPPGESFERGKVRSSGAAALLGERDAAAWLRRLRGTGLILPLAILWIVLAGLNSTFLTTQNIENLFLSASGIGILAISTTAVLITEEIDLSISSIEGIVAVVVGIAIVNHGISWPAGVVIGLAVGAGVGLVNGIVTTRVGVPSFITTLATNGVCAGAALLFTGGQTIYNFPQGFQNLGQATIRGVGLPVIVAGALALVLYVMLRRTRLGLNIYSVGGNARAARLVGISPARVKTAAFMISGAGAAVAGILAAARLNAANGTYGQADLLNAIAAVVIGGTSLSGGEGSVIGTTFGVLLVATIQNGLNILNVSPFWQEVAIGGIILAMGIMTVKSRRAEH